MLSGFELHPRWVPLTTQIIIITVSHLQYNIDHYTVVFGISRLRNNIYLRRLSFEDNSEA